MLCGFLLVHLMGNMLLYAGAEAFNNYAYALTSKKAILYSAEFVLLGLFGTHIVLALKLAKENRAARGAVRYAVNAQSGDMNIFTRTMPYSGAWILVFLILHLINFKYAPNAMVDGQINLYNVVVEHFKLLHWSIYYIVTMAIISGHVYHGVQSSLQTFGINHPRHNGLIKVVSLIYALVIFVGYSSFPVYFLIKG